MIRVYDQSLLIPSLGFVTNSTFGSCTDWRIWVDWNLVSVNRGHAQTLLVQLVQLTIRLVFITIEATAPSSPASFKLFLEQTGRMVTYVLHHLLFPLAIFIPIVDIVDTVLFLQPFQKRLVLLRYSLSLLITSSPIQRFGNGLHASIFEHVPLWVGLFSAELWLKGWDRRHVSLLVLREVRPGTSQNASHALQ